MKRVKPLLGVVAILLPLACKLVLPTAHEDCAATTRSECANCLTLVHANTAIVPPPAQLPQPANRVEGLSIEPQTLQPLPETLRTPSRAPPAA
jgi:hypothetical protein